MPATAIDIGTYSIKTITGKPGDKPKIDKILEISNPLNFAYPNNDAEAEKLTEILDAFFNDHKLPKKDVRLSLPEEVVTTKIIELPVLSNAELASAIDWQAEQHIPIPKEDLSLEYRVLYRPPKKNRDTPMKVMLIGTKKSLIERYVAMFYSIGVQPKILETQIFSIIRSLSFEENDPVTLIAHLGAANMLLGVVEEANLKLVFNHQGCGQLLTKTLQQSIGNLTLEQAQEYKHTYGLNPNQLQGKINQVLLPALGSLTNELQKILRYYNNQNPQQTIQRIVLSGGTAQLIGIVEHIIQLTNNEVLVASPFASSNGQKPETNHQAFIVCMGLMTRNS